MHVARLAMLVVVCLLLVACKQGDGEVCQIDDDCESGFCANVRETGICRERGTPDSGPMLPDAGDDEDEDAAPDDPDAAPDEPDAAPADAGEPDA
jgi:hypothetical protein